MNTRALFTGWNISMYFHKGDLKGVHHCTEKTLKYILTKGQFAWLMNFQNISYLIPYKSHLLYCEILDLTAWSLYDKELSWRLIHLTASCSWKKIFRFSDFSQIYTSQLCNTQNIAAHMSSKSWYYLREIRSRPHLFIYSLSRTCQEHCLSDDDLLPMRVFL